jgi:hypothetical protein
MKKHLALLCLGFLVLSSTPSFSAVNALVTVQFSQGDNLFANPLQTGDNSLATLFPTPPDGVAISLWNPQTHKFDRISTFKAGTGWTTNFMLNPGQGALLHTSVGFANTFNGIVLDPNGFVYDPDQSFGLPAQFAGASGQYLLASKFPVDLSTLLGWPVYPWVLGRGPQQGEQFMTLDRVTQTYRTTTYSATGWNNGEPILEVGESAFFNTLAVPVLQFARAGSSLVLWWPASASNFLPETSTNVAPGAVWTPLPGGIVPAGTNLFQTNLITGPTGFFRLRLQ